MHRDPTWGKWEEMHPIDRELRITSWWLLIIADRNWSFVLGRPPMAPRWSHDVKTLPSDFHADGTPNHAAGYHRALIGLADLIADTIEKVTLTLSST